MGTVLNVVCGATRTKMGALISAITPFLLAELAVLFLLVLFPSIVTVPAAWFAR
ncbi:hypothetical protein D3C85_1784100 [compost metagenome]